MHNVILGIVFIIIIIVCLYGLQYDEGFEAQEEEDLRTFYSSYNDYNKHVYPLREKLSEKENEFVEKWIHKLENEDFERKGVSVYIISFTIHEDGTVNKSRFCIGTTTKYSEFETDSKELLKNLKITHNIVKPKNYNYYGIAWDLENEIIKLYLINDKYSKIVCYVYSVKGNEEKDKPITVKKYDVSKNETTMIKDGKHVKQFNSRTLPQELLDEYPLATELIEHVKTTMEWNVDTYSEYDSKLNLYFDMLEYLENNMESGST